MNENCFYNTTKVAGKLLDKYREAASNQETLIRLFFSENKGAIYTPFDIHKELFLENSTPITSTRRAITNLTKKGILTKTPIKKIGDFGRQCFCWTML